MRVKVLSIALIGALVALPVPASQLLAGTFPASAPAVLTAAQTGALRTLIADPFLIDQMSYTAPKSFLETETGVDPHDI